jgi:hypothetical protein
MSQTCLFEAQEASKYNIEENVEWKDYILDFAQNVILPVNYIYESSPFIVRNLDHLIDPNAFPSLAQISASQNPDRNWTANPVRLILDFGKNTGGKCFIDIESNIDMQIDVTFSESLETIAPAGDIGSNNSRLYTIASDTSGNIEIIKIVNSRSMIYGQRYITLYFKPTSLNAIVAINRIYTEIKHFQPTIDDYTGHFLSNDNLLNKVWYSGVYTNSMCLTPQRIDDGPFVIVDGAKRDEVCWLGDILVETLTNYAAFGNKAYEFFRTTIAQWDNKQQASGNVPPAVVPLDGSAFEFTYLSEYTADYVILMADYYRISGDSVFVSHRLPIIRNILDKFYMNNLNSEGLFLSKANITDNITWNVDFGPGVIDLLNTLNNASFYQALKDGAFIETSIGDPSRALTYNIAADNLKIAINDKFWDNDAKVLFGNDQDPGAHYQDGNVRSIYYGILDKTRSKSSLNFLKKNMWTENGTLTTDNQEPNNGSTFMQCNISPYMTGYEQLARFSQDDTCNALTLIRNTQGKMVERDPRSTLFERLWKDGGIGTYLAAQAQLNIYRGLSFSNNIFATKNPKDYYSDLNNSARGFISLAHGWSATSTYALSKYILGIHPVTPGFLSWLIRPQIGDLKWAQGQFPTPHGVIVSRFETGKCHCGFKLTISAPSNTSGSVYIPLFGKKRKIFANGKRIKYTIKDDYALIENVIGFNTYAWGYFKYKTSKSRKILYKNINKIECKSMSNNIIENNSKSTISMNPKNILNDNEYIGNFPIFNSKENYIAQVLNSI